MRLSERSFPRQLQVLLLLALFSLLAACAETRIRGESQDSLAAGDYERALKRLETGVKQYPNSISLRSGLMQARNEAQTRLMASAAALRVSGQLDEAQQELERALVLEPQNNRVQALLGELALERRQQSALAQARQWADAGQVERALRHIEQVLKDQAHHAGLLALQQKLQARQRSEQVRAAQGTLAETRPISLDFREASLRTVLDVVSRHSGINFVLDRDVRVDTRVTVFMQQARVEDALDLITSTHQLAKKVIDPQTIVFYPNTTEKQREYQEQVVRVFHLTSSEAKGAAAFLKAMLKIRDPFVDERINMLALRESEENIQLAERLIAVYDSGEPEVLLEVEVMEVSSTRLTELGVKFPSSFTLAPLAPNGGTQLTLGNIEGLTRNRIGLGLGNTLVNLKREVGDLATLANPRIRVRNKEKAKILIGDKIPVIAATTGTGGFVAESVSYLDVGLKLDVEPAIYADDEVAIKVALEVSTLGTAIKTSSGSLAYQIGTRSASTLLRLRDGETQLLAGLISRDERTNASRVPGVGDLPVLGRLFSSQQDDAKRTELVLAITPRVLRNVRRMEASETELWVGTDASPRLKPVGGLRAPLAKPDAAASKPLVPSQEPAGKPVDGAPVKPASLSWLAPSRAKVGEVVEFTLQLSEAQGLRGLTAELGYAPDRLEFLDVTEGELFRRGEARTSFTKSADAGKGRVNVGVLRNQASAAQGQGSIVSLRFRAKTAGATELTVLQLRSIALEGGSPSPTAPSTWPLELL